MIEVTDGDLRRSINTLQTCSSFGKDRALTAKDIESISGVVPNDVVSRVDTIVTTNGVTYSEIQRLAEDLILDGFDC